VSLQKGTAILAFSLGLFFALVLGVQAQDNDLNEACFACHARPGFQTTLPSGEVLYLTVDPEVYNNSVHGLQGFFCIHCHSRITDYPHPPLTVETHRDLSLSLYRSSCIDCHPAEYDTTLDSVHQKALAGGHLEAAICTDCHGTHNIQPPDEPLSRSSQMCELCHSEIFELYKGSIHGSALLAEGNPDVPSCVDCHEVHSVQGPTTDPFRLFSPQICAKCHADAELMEKYGISTDVFDTYVSDFHGTTVLLFQTTAPDQETNKPVCIDCHGVHDMKQVDDPESQVIKENLLVTCQKCHPDAEANFPTSWVSHYRPSPQHAPLVFFVNLFYAIFIPTLLGGMVLFVATDVCRRILGRKNKEGQFRG
jgi:hypothetical protein